MKKEWWDQALQYYTEQTDPVYAKRYLEIKQLDWRLTEINKGDLILDVGTGKPVDVIRAAWLGAYFIALDLAAKELSSGKSFMKRELPNLYSFADFIVADATRLPFKHEVFDMVTSYSAIEHVASLEKQQKWINEMARVTKNGGKVILSTENRFCLICYFFSPFRMIDYKKLRRPRILCILATFILFWLSEKFKLFKKYLPLKSDFYECFFSPNEVTEMLIKAGLTITTFESSTLYYWGYGPPFLAFSRLALKIDRLLNKLERVECLKIFGKIIGFSCTKYTRAL